MNRILIFKTSEDKTLKVLLRKIKKNVIIDCLVSQREMLQWGHNTSENIKFTSIEKDGFYDVPDHILQEVYKNTYDVIYITLSGIHGYNYWNVLDILRKCNYKKAYFFNCNGEQVRIEKKSIFKSKLIKGYISVIEYLYS